MHFRSPLQALSLASLLALSLVTATPHSSSPISPPSTGLQVEVDICAYIDISINVGAKIISDILDIEFEVVIDIKECLCLEALVAFCTERARSRGLSATQQANLLAGLASTLQGSGGPGKTCTYPSTPGCTQMCSASNVCGFSCPSGYTPSTDSFGNPTCICSSPDQWSCNGQCVSKDTPCTSPPASKKRRLPHPAKPWCPRGKSVCGIYGGGADSWECVDTTADLESCGGCTIPHRSTSIPGRDCTQIPHIADVACVRGSCEVSRCRKGFVVANNGTLCVPDASGSRHRFSTQLVRNPIHIKD